MRRNVAAFLTTIVVLAAAPAWAALVNVTVTNGSGSPVNGAIVKIGGTETTTGPDGKARLDVEPGPHWIETTYEGRTLRHAITVERRADVQEFPVTLSAQTPGGSPGIQSPVLSSKVRRPLESSGLFGLGAVVGRQVIDDSLLQSQTITDQRTTGTSTQSTTNNTPSTLLTADNRNAKKTHRQRPMTRVSITVPLSSSGVGPFGDRRRDRIARPEHSSDGRAADQSGSGGGGWRFYPSISAGAGPVEVQFDSVDSAVPNNTNFFKGSGMMVSLGANAVLFPCANCGWFVRASYGYARTSQIDVARTPTLQSRVAAGVRETRDEVTYAYRAHTIDGSAGYTFDRMTLRAGVRSVRHRPTLGGQFAFDLAPGASTAATQTITFANVFAEDSVEAVGGADIRIPRTPLVLRLEGAGNGRNRSVSAGVAFGFGR